MSIAITANRTGSVYTCNACHQELRKHESFNETMEAHACAAHVVQHIEPEKPTKGHSMYKNKGAPNDHAD